MEYRKLINGDPASDNPNEVVGLVRFENSIYEYYNKRKKAWVVDPELLGFISGLGGDGYDYKPIKKTEVDAIIKRWADGD